MKRLAIAAVGLALVVSLGGLLFGGCGGHDGKLHEYAQQMQGYFNGFYPSPRPEMADLTKLVDIQPPKELESAHKGLLLATRMVVLSQRHADGLEASEQERWDRESDDGTVVACINLEADQGLRDWASEAFNQACTLKDYAFDAYVDETIEWSTALSKACGGPDFEVLESSAIETCLK